MEPLGCGRRGSLPLGDGMSRGAALLEGLVMLILSRKEGEVIMIDDHIRIVVDEIRGDKVRLGFDAPQDVTIDRLEIWQSKRQEVLDNDAA